MRKYNLPPTCVENSRAIVETLTKVKSIYHKVLEMSREGKERIYIQLLSCMAEKCEEMKIREICEDLLERPMGNINYFDGDSLLGIFEEILESNGFTSFMYLFPFNLFNINMIVFRLGNDCIQDKFKKIEDMPENDFDRFVIGDLIRHINNTLVDNYNFKGEDPYYKKNPIKDSDIKLWLEFLDKDFDNYIDYFRVEDF